MEIVEGIISRQDLSALAQNLYGDMIKAVADVDKGLLAIDAELHSDLERMLLECFAVLPPSAEDKPSKSRTTCGKICRR